MPGDKATLGSVQFIQRHTELQSTTVCVTQRVLSANWCIFICCSILLFLSCYLPRLLFVSG